MLEEKKWLIWSIEHDAWWRPNRCGYTHHVESAGRYSYGDALKIVAGANWGSGPVVDEDPDQRLSGRPFEAMIREDSYGRFYKNPRGDIKS